MDLKDDAYYIVNKAIHEVLPDVAVAKALQQQEFRQLVKGRIFVVAVGKAAWQMAKTASAVLKDELTDGIVCTKYGHVKGQLPKIRCYEGGHPVPDDNSFAMTQAVLDMVADLKATDTVLFLLSGGGSALFEKPLIAKEELFSLTKQLLACGADITEINTIRKRLSAVKGGRFAKICQPAHVYSIVLSDIIGDPLDMIASGPAYFDSSTSEEALTIAAKCNLTMSPQALSLLEQETPKQLNNVTTVITGSVRNLCTAAAAACRELGYTVQLLTDELTCQAKEAGSFLGAIAKTHQDTEQSLAFIAGGETIVNLLGTGKGGRNQELALSAAVKIEGLPATAVFSIGSDGTDGPTDAAGGYCDGNTKDILAEKGIDIFTTLQNNDAYTALAKANGLIITGATGTNVNDVAVVLIKR